jgi:ferredoxin
MGTTDAPPTQNAGGRYAITEECDGCGLCVSYSASAYPVDSTDPKE